MTKNGNRLLAVALLGAFAIASLAAAQTNVGGDKEPGTVPFFALGVNGGNPATPDLVLVRAEPPFDTLASFFDVPGTGGSWAYTSKDDRFLYIGTDGPYVAQIATSDFTLRKIYTQAYHSYVIEPGEEYLYTVNYGDGRILKHDIASGQVVDEIVWGVEKARAPGTYLVQQQGPAARGPSVLSPDGRYWYLTPEVVNDGHSVYDTAHIFKFDLETDEIVGALDTGESAGAHMSNFISADGKYMYYGSYRGKYLMLIDLESFTVEDVWKEDRLTNWHAVHPEPNGERVWLLFEQGEAGYAAVFDVGPGPLSDNLVGFVGPFPRALESSSQRVLHMIEFTPDNRYAITDNMHLDEVYVIDVDALAVIKTIEIGNARKGLPYRLDFYGTDHPLLTPDARYFAVAVVYDNTYEIYDTQTGDLMTTVQFAEEGESVHYTRGFFPGYPMGNMMASRTVAAPVADALTIAPTQYSRLIAAESLLPDQAHLADLEVDRVIEVVGSQYAWEPEEIRVQQGEVITLRITSEDVPHSLFLPDFGVDVSGVKGAWQEVTLVADTPGSFMFLCGDSYCGIDHGRMIGRLIVEAE